MIDFSASVEPHDFVPYRWLDNLRPHWGRCKHCIVDRSNHPIVGWAPARAVNDGAIYSPRLILLALDAWRAKTAGSTGDKR